MHGKNLLTAADIRQRHHHLAVKATGTQKRRVKYVRTIGGGDDDHICAGIEAVHFNEHLIECLLAFIIAAAEAGAALTADRINFVDEDDAGSILLGGFKHVAHAGCAHADEHFNEVGTRNCEERHTGFAGNSLSEQRLAGTRGAHEQHAARDAAAQTLVLRRIAQEVDDFLHVFLGFVAACNVLEANLVVLLGEHAGLGLPKREGAAAARTALHAAHEEDPHADEKDHREPGDEDGRQKRRLLLGLAVDLNVALPELVHHPDVARIRDGVLSSGLRRDEDLATLHLHFADLARLSVIHKLGVARLIERLRRVGLKLAENREEHHRDENPYGNAGKRLIVQL